MGDHFDEQLPTRLADLAAVDATPVNPALFATIRGRAAAQRRRRRGTALVAAAATLLVGLGGGVVVRAAVLHEGPTAVSPAGEDPPLSWPVRGDLGPSTEAALVHEAAAAWDQESAAGAHRQVRLLLSLEYKTQHIRVIKGATAGGQVRIAVLVSPPAGTSGTAQDARPLQVSLDVAAPSTEPKAIVVTLAGLGSPVHPGEVRTYDEGLIIAVLAPTAGAATVRWAPPTVPPAGGISPMLLEIDPSKGYQTQDTRTAATTGRLAPDGKLASAFTLTTAGDAGQPVGFSRVALDDGPSPALPDGIPETALLVPQLAAVSVPAPTR
jgi:hypothetical protein